MLQQKKVFVNPGVGELWALVAVPENRAEGEKLPLLVFLHGSGERGHDIDDLCTHAVPRLVKEGREIPALFRNSSFFRAASESFILASSHPAQRTG